MRVFWSLMLVLFVASMGVFVRPMMPDRVPTRGEQADIVRKPMQEPVQIKSGPQEQGVAPSEPQSEPMTIEGEKLRRAMQRLSDQTGEPVVTVDAGGPLVPINADDEASENEAIDLTPATEAPVPESDEAPGTEAPAEPTADPFAAAAEAYLRRSRSETAQPEADAKPAVNAITETPVASENTEAPTSQPEPEPETKAPASEQTQTAPILQPDGSLRIGNTVVLGDGSAARPYELDWPLLTGVARDYKPEKGMKDLPEWLSLLEGKRVRLTGHVVLPLVATSTDELLLTMNPWDGCCVGVPPTPYDAMEVTTSEPVSMQGASMYGTLEGTFRTDPYIAGGWLLGLYLLDDARVVK